MKEYLYVVVDKDCNYACPPCPTYKIAKETAKIYADSSVWIIEKNAYLETTEEMGAYWEN